MKKNVFSIFAVVLFMSSFVNLKANVEVENSLNDSIIVKDLCAQYADFAAAVIEEEDGTNYYQAWFASYRYCTSQIDYSLDY